MSDHVLTRVEKRVNAPAAQVWEYLGWQGAAKLRDVSLIDRITLEDETSDVGSMRTLHLKDGTSITEYVEAINEQERWYVYKPIDLGSLPVREYTGRLSVAEDGSDACVVTIESRCIPVGISVNDWQKVYTDLETAVIDHVRNRVEGK